MKPTIPTKVFHLSIGSVSQTPELANILQNDLRMVKAGLLYADRVNLYSLTASMAIYFLGLSKADVNFDQIIEFLKMFESQVIPNLRLRHVFYEGLKRYEAIGHNPQASLSERMWRLDFRKQIDDLWSEAAPVISDTLQKAGIEELNRAYKTDRLELYSFKKHGRDWVWEYFDQISSAVSNGNTYPLLDNMTGELIRRAILEGKMTVSESGIARAKHIGLAGHLMQDLPLFDAASIDEILDIRKELDRYLARFRSAMIAFSDTIKIAAWDKDFPAEADTLFYREVAPVISELEEAVQSNKLLVALAHASVDKPATITGGSALGLLLSQLSALPQIITLASTIGVAAGAASIMHEAYKEWKKKQIEIEHNQLFFYYRAGAMLRH
jgi:hypothetical protein